MGDDIEVLIVSYDSSGALGSCLASIQALAPTLPVAIREHSADPEAGDRLRAVVARSDLRVRLEFDPTNPGFGAGCNALARTSSASWYVFVNPDVEFVEWPWAADDPPGMTIVGASMTDPNATLRHSGRSYRLMDEIARSWLRRRRPVADGIGFVSGAAMLVDAAAFDALAGFDERYFLFYEDIDLCLRANNAGIRTHVEPMWIVRHHGGHSTRSRFGQALGWSYESGCRFHASQGSPLAVYRSYVIVDAIMRAVVSGLRRQPDRSSAYRALAARAAGELTPQRFRRRATR